ncbi:MAG TPA: hypothetical protein VI300_22950 [Solirubrobacter sp.]
MDDDAARADLRGMTQSGALSVGGVAVSGDGIVRVLGLDAP